MTTPFSFGYQMMDSYLAESNLPAFLSNPELLSVSQRLWLAFGSAAVFFLIQMVSHGVLSCTSFYRRMLKEDQENAALARSQASSKVAKTDSKLTVARNGARGSSHTMPAKSTGRKSSSSPVQTDESVSEAVSKAPRIELIKTTKLNVIVVSTAFASFIVTVSYYVMHLAQVNPEHVFVKALVASRMRGRSRLAEIILTIAQGYFIWDLIICIWHHREYDASYLLHAIVCLTVYSIFSCGHMMYYAIIFLSYEASSLLLNWRSAYRLVYSSGTPLYSLISLSAMGAFFYVRIYQGLFGYFFELLEDLVKDKNAPEPMSSGFYKFSMMCNIILNGLNVFWFAQMCMILVKMVVPLISGLFKRSKLA